MYSSLHSARLIPYRNLIPLWIWIGLYGGAATLAVAVCQRLQLILSIFPPRYWPPACPMRNESKAKRLTQSANSQPDIMLGSDVSCLVTGHSETASTKHLVSHPQVT